MEERVPAVGPALVPGVPGGAPEGAKATTIHDVGGARPAAAPAPVTHGFAPAIHLAAATAHASEAEKDIAEMLVHQIVEGIFPTPYLAAHEVARGKHDFCRDFRRVFQRAAAPHPLICGRIDASRFANLAWEIAKNLVVAYHWGTWRRRVWADKTTARQVIADYEKHFHQPKTLEPIDEVKVTIEGRDNTSITGDEFISSGNKRVGTLHEIIEDVADPELRAAGHHRVEEMVAETKQIESERGKPDA